LSRQRFRQAESDVPGKRYAQSPEVERAVCKAMELGPLAFWVFPYVQLKILDV
jgi:hypothetical protein